MTKADLIESLGESRTAREVATTLSTCVEPAFRSLLRAGDNRGGADLALRVARQLRRKGRGFEGVAAHWAEQACVGASMSDPPALFYEASMELGRCCEKTDLASARRAYLIAAHYAKSAARTEAEMMVAMVLAASTLPPNPAVAELRALKSLATKAQLDSAFSGRTWAPVPA